MWKMSPEKTTPDGPASFKNLPSIQELLSDRTIRNAPIDPRYGKVLARRTVQEFREKLRRSQQTPSLSRGKLKEAILAALLAKIEALVSPRMERVINGTGIILHTNLGRAPLAGAARVHLNEIAENYSNLEIDLAGGRRGNRISIVEEIICLITGAEAAVVVNNNAAAILLALNSLCRRKEVPVSRGELVEIGGSFRMPEVMKAGQAKMVEVGTTNKTHLSDYEKAISARSGGILKVHTSNYRVLGFTGSVAVTELVSLARRHGLPLIYDMGSGVIEDLQNWGYPHEPVAREYVDAGVDVITFSGDKVLGGAQAGIIIGKKQYMDKIKKNHLLRALRAGKLTYALLDATLRLYLNPAKLPASLPAAAMLTVPAEELRRRGRRLIENLNGIPAAVELIDTFSQMGSGALPLEKIPSVAVRIRPEKLSAGRLARKMRLAKPGVVGYIENEAYLINLRTVREDEYPAISANLHSIFSGG